MDGLLNNATRCGAQHPTSRCGLTVLRTTGNARATKQWVWDDFPDRKRWRRIDYQAGAQFLPTEHSVSNLADLAKVLDTVRRDPCAFVVRGALTPEAAAAVAANPRHQIRRLKHASGNVKATLLEVPRCWIMVDIDKWPLRTVDDLATDPESAIDHAIHELLPAAFHDVECFWQLSSSAGFVPGILKVHLWFWLTEPATSEHVKAVFKQHAPGIDDAPFNAAQIHYIADPIIEGGYDPLPVRTGLRQGLDEAVTLPALKPQTVRPRAASTGPSGSVSDALATMGDSEGLDGFHAPLRTATMRYARRCSRYNERDDEAIKAQLRTAIRAAPQAKDRNVEAVYCTDTYLDRMISGAFALLAGDAEAPAMLPHHTPAAPMSLEDARAETLRQVQKVFDRAFIWNALDDDAKVTNLAEHAALVVGVGVGKSTAAREALEAFIYASKATGQPYRVLWLVPAHKLVPLHRGFDGLRPGEP